MGQLHHGGGWAKLCTVVGEIRKVGVLLL